MHAGILKTEKTFKDAATQFLREYEIITQRHRSKRWTEGHAIRLRVHLLPFFGDLGLSEITGGKVQEYRVHRMSSRGVLAGEVMGLIVQPAVGWLPHRQVSQPICGWSANQNPVSSG